MPALNEAPSLTRRLARMNLARLRALLGRNPQVAAECVYAIATEGCAAAQLCYGRMLLAGTGVAPDPRAAYRWFRRAAASGDREAINMVGRCLDNGWGVPADPAAAARHYQRAADAGCSWAQYNLGHLYLDGRGLRCDPGKAFACYRSAALQEHARGMNLLARCHEEAWGTPKNAEAAAHWYRRSAERGYFRGQYNWATVLLRAGRIDEAAHWFERAANGGTDRVRLAVVVLARASGVARLQALAEQLTRSGKESRCSYASQSC
jgi:TPR repeat protein